MRRTERSMRLVKHSSKRRKRSEVEVDWSYDSDEVQSQNDEDNIELERRQVKGEEKQETADQKRIRLAKEYLSRIQAEEESDTETQNKIEGDDKISEKIRNELLSKSGRLRRNIAAKFRSAEKVGENRLDPEIASCTSHKGHKKPTTCLAISEAEDVFYTGAKDCSINRWDTETGRILKTFTGLPRTKAYRNVTNFEGHRDEVLAIALSTDGKYLASAGRERLVYIWDTRTDTIVERLKGHRDAISGLSFQLNSSTLMSCSFDRSVRVWNANDFAFIEELYGHQSEINCIDSMYRERCLTASVDRTIRFWKIPEETQLVFPSIHTASIDTVKMIDEVHFVAGSQDGSISLWHTSKKRPFSLLPNVHSGCWVTSVSALRNSNLLASGSHDGYVNFWEIDFEEKEIPADPCASICLNGFVNALAFAPSGKFLVAATGMEHRFGRWEKDNSAINGIEIVRFSNKLIE